MGILQKFVNGGIYRVNFDGTSDADFQGDHPTLIVRTLKEDDVYLVVPLTSYTEEKMEKARRVGFGYRIKSTNSIARIDKVKIINRSNIKNRWKEGNNFLRLSKEELFELNSKVNDYITLTTEKAHREYEKYAEQFESTTTFFNDFFKNGTSAENIFSVENQSTNSTLIKCNKRDVHWLSTTDIVEIALSFYPPEKIRVYIKDACVFINIQKTP